VHKQEIWSNIHAGRADLADALEGLDEAQWATPSWCAGWSVKQVTAHVVAAAEQTTFNFYKELAQAGFKFSSFTDRGVRALDPVPPAALVARLRARTTTTNHPPAPVMAMLGEIVVHGQDVRRPLGLAYQPPEAALVAVADSWKSSNLLIGAKRRIAGVRLSATDVAWSHGDGPEASGPLLALVLAMTGRRGALDQLAGDGVGVLAARP